MKFRRNIGDQCQNFGIVAKPVLVDFRTSRQIPRFQAECAQLRAVGSFRKFRKLLDPIIVVGVIERLSVVMPMPSPNSVVPSVLVCITSPPFSRAILVRLTAVSILELVRILGLKVLSIEHVPSLKPQIPV